MGDGNFTTKMECLGASKTLITDEKAGRTTLNLDIDTARTKVFKSLK